MAPAQRHRRAADLVGRSRHASPPRRGTLTRGRRDIVVAVADDGFDLTHPDFQGDGKVVGAAQRDRPGQQISAGIDWDDDVRPRPGSR